jgi:hypothetical protein
MATLVGGTLSAGEHSVVWDASGVASGVYFARLTAGEETAMVRMALIR